MREVEIKAAYPQEATAALAEYLLGKGYCHTAEYRQEDDYYNHPSRNFMETDEAVRLRRTCQGEQDVTVFTYKGKNQSERGQSREELETGVGDAAIMRKALDRLGFRRVVSVYKTRRTYCCEDVTVCLDDVEELGSFLEIEIICPDEQASAAEARLSAMLEELRFASPVEEGRTYLELLLRKRAKHG